MQCISLTCNKCGISFDKQLKEYNRQISKNKNSKFFCSSQCFYSSKVIINLSVKRNCLWCNSGFDSINNRKCCSSSCRSKYSRSKSSQENRTAGMVLYHKNKIKVPVKMETRICASCGILFEWEKWRSDRKTCSDKCFKELCKSNSISNINCGGETGFKKFSHNGFSMDSSWEVDIAKWMDSQSIAWNRSKKDYVFWWTDVEGTKRRYYPDFYLSQFNLFIDPKNKYKLEIDLYKLKKVESENNVKIIYGSLDEIKKQLTLLKSGV